MKIILLKTLKKKINNVAKNFDILATKFYIIILMIQQNYFYDMYPAKILDLSAKLFFPCTYFFFSLCYKFYNEEILYFIMHM